MESLKKHIFAQRIKTGTSQDLLRIKLTLMSRLIFSARGYYSCEQDPIWSCFFYWHLFISACPVTTEIPQPPRDDLPGWMATVWKYGTPFLLTALERVLGERFAVCVHEQFELSHMRTWGSNRHVYSFLLMLSYAHISSFPLKSPWSFIKWVWIKIFY